MTDEELAAELIQRAEAIEMTAGPEMSDVKRFRLAAARLRGLVTTATRDAERLRLLEAVEAAADRFAFCGNLFAKRFHQEYTFCGIWRYPDWGHFAA